MTLFRPALFLLLTFPAWADGEITITVRDPSGAAITAAQGWMEDLARGSRQRFTTGPEGTAKLPSPAQGRYRIELSKPGFATLQRVVEIPGERDWSFTLGLGTAASSVEVAGSTPVGGADRTLDEIPSPVQTASAADIRSSGAPDLSSFLNRRLNGVYLNEIQGNPFQPDLNYRGYTASPLLGTPQGISIYLDGVRLNQPFGDVVSWDLIPRAAIAEAALVPGSNPLFGSNTLGGAIALRSKDGFTQPGTAIELGGGSWGRKSGEFEHGGSSLRTGLHWYLASQFLFEDGWRETSNSSVRQFFGKLGWQGRQTSATLSLGYANNGLLGNGLQDFQFLDRNYSSVYTKPDQTANRAPSVTLNLRHGLTSRWTLSANSYFRHIRTRTLNGDINEESLDQSVYQPNAAERAALAAAGLTGFPTAGETSANTPFPRWRCIANVLLRDEPGEKCNGLINTGASQQRHYGVNAQANGSFSRGALRNQITFGGGYDGYNASYSQLSELGYLNPDRTITGLFAFADGVTGGDTDGEPLDTRVSLSSRVHSGSFLITDTLSVGSTWAFTFSGRYSSTSIDNFDRIRPRAGTGSLTGNHTFQRFNPAAGLTYRAPGNVQFYFSYSQGSRAPSAIELGCADPESPCKLPNALAGDPPLNQVTTSTFEAGIRGGQNGESRLRWSAGWFRAVNRDDILFVASPQSGFGYFKNFGETLRQGAEADLRVRLGRVTLGGGYTFLSATFESAEEVNGTGNSTNEEAEDGIPGVEGTIDIHPGNRIPLTPRHMAKAFADIQVTRGLQVTLGVVGMSSAIARGNENNSHKPDGRIYLGEGSTPGYAVVNLGARYQIHSRVQLFVETNNLLDRRYYTGSQLGPLGFTNAGAYVARPFPAVQGQFPVRQTAFLAPGAPRAAWGGIRLRLF